MLKKTIKWILIVAVTLYAVLCIMLYTTQENSLFFPQKLDTEHSFYFNQSFEELSIETHDGIELNSVLFKADSAKGLIFYLHGNAGSIEVCGYEAMIHTDYGYDVFLLDYRGFGKSEGKISSQKQIYSDVQVAYDSMKNRYKEENIVIIGYSIGTGLASKLASENKPRQLILQAPYYSLPDLVKRWNPIVPTFLLKYKFRNHEHIEKCTMPITIFHGNKDEVIYYGSSLKLKEHITAKDTVIILEDQMHSAIVNNLVYLEEIEKVLRQ